MCYRVPQPSHAATIACQHPEWSGYCRSCIMHSRLWWYVQEFVVLSVTHACMALLPGQGSARCSAAHDVCTCLHWRLHAYPPQPGQHVLPQHRVLNHTNLCAAAWLAQRPQAACLPRRLHFKGTLYKGDSGLVPHLGSVFLELLVHSHHMLALQTSIANSVQTLTHSPHSYCCSIIFLKPEHGCPRPLGYRTWAVACLAYSY